MVTLIKNDVLKIKILRKYKQKNISYTANHLSTFFEEKYETVKRALEFFVEINLIDKEIKEHGTKDYVYYNLTDLGRNLIAHLI